MPTREPSMTAGGTAPASRLRVLVVSHVFDPEPFRINQVVADLVVAGAEATVLTVLLGSTLKDENGQMTLQAQTGGGPIELLVCDYRGGELGGYLKFDAADRKSTRLNSSH